MDKQELRFFLQATLKKEAGDYFGIADNDWLDNVTNSWLNDRNNSQWRYEDIDRYCGHTLNKQQRILDMACGCGTFVFYGLLNGLNVWGIDPEDWKLQFNRDKCDVYGYPAEWKSRFIKGVGEALPFPDAYFDFVSSYQTLEHVQNVELCMSEMIRVIKGGGVLFLRMPDYRSTFEGHYRLPWLPLLPRTIARFYLKLMGRPIKGLSTINYVTAGNIKRLLSKNCDVKLVIEPNKEQFIRTLEKQYLINTFWQNVLYAIWKLIIELHNIFRHEFSIDLVVVKKA